MISNAGAAVAAVVTGLITAQLSGCYGNKTPQPIPHQPSSGGTTMPFKLTSTAFPDGGAIPRKHSGEGENLSPPLAWTGVPEGTQEFALICDDPDAPSAEPWVHWVIYGIAGETTSLPEGVPAAQAQLDQPLVARQGRNSWGTGVTIGYRGPMPPPGHGTHHYRFKLYALDQTIDLPPSATKRKLLTAIQGHVLAEAEVAGTYAR